MSNDQRLTITQVAVRLKLKYHKARDWMLRGKFGEVQYEGHTLTVSLAAVEEWEKHNG